MYVNCQMWLECNNYKLYVINKSIDKREEEQGVGMTGTSAARHLPRKCKMSKWRKDRYSN